MESKKDIMNAVMLAGITSIRLLFFFNVEKQIQMCVLMYTETHVYRTYTHVCTYVYINSACIYLLTLREGLEEGTPTS